MIESLLEQSLRAAFEAAKKVGELQTDALPAFLLETPAITTHGDLAANIALQLAKSEQKPPRKIAEILVRHLACPEFVLKTEIAGPGFINFHLKPEAYFHGLQEVLKSGEKYGRTNLGKGQKVLIEFVSANPTGPLNIVSARAAAFGNTLASLLEACGYKAAREFYVNDIGNQIRLFAESIWARSQQSIGKESPIPEGGYHGEYLVSFAKELIAKKGEGFFKKPKEKIIPELEVIGVQAMVEAQRKCLERFGVRFDRWFFQSELFQKKSVAKILEKLEKEGQLYVSEGAVYFRSTPFGDDKDRVVKKTDGECTYFASDIAYHDNKFQRADSVIDILGPDHHGFIARLKAAVQVCGHSLDNFEVLIVQQVNLLDQGEILKMSKRAGKIIEMSELMDEVGVDVGRFFFLMRSASTPLDFDLDLAKKETPENPVFYIQYAHARICSIFEKAKEAGIKPNWKKVDCANLILPDEKELAKKILEYPKIIATAAKERAPHKLATYLLELAQTFQSYYSKAREDPRYRVINTQAPGQTEAKLYLLKNIQIVLQNALKMLGISAPERMDSAAHEL